MSKVDQRLSRRRLVAGAGTVGTLAAAASLMPRGGQSAPQPSAVQPAEAAQAGSYRETDHVLRYYRTART